MGAVNSCGKKLPGWRGNFSPNDQSSSCFFTLCKVQNGSLFARSFRRCMVSSLGAAGGSSSLTTPGLFFRDIEVKAVMVVCDGQVARLLVFIRNYCESILSKIVPPPVTIYYAYIGALILLRIYKFDPLSA
jgi:hypothetical protein